MFCCSRCKNTFDLDFKLKSKNLCKACNAKKSREHRKKYPEKHLEYKRKYRDKNREAFRAQRRIYMRKKCSNVLFKLRKNLRTRLWLALKGKKQLSVLLTLGCTLEEFKQHLESKFKPGMSWDNYGKWELDHIIPISHGKTEKEIYELNTYKNIQPLWSLENKRKGNKING